MHPFNSAGTLLAVGVICAGLSAAAQAPPPVEPARGAPYLVYATHPAKGGAKLSVSSPAFQAGSDIPFENTQYRGNVFPA